MSHAILTLYRAISAEAHVAEALYVLSESAGRARGQERPHGEFRGINGVFLERKRPRLS